ERELAANDAGAGVLALGVGREDLTAALLHGDVVAEPLDDLLQTLLVAQPVLALEPQCETQEINLGDVVAPASAVQVVEVHEEAIAGGVDAEELELQRVTEPLRL